MDTFTESVMRRIILVSIFIVPFLAFFVPNSFFFPFIDGKNFGFRVLVEVMFFAWIPLAYYRAEYRPKFSWILVALSSFTAIIFLADIFGANPYRSFWSNYERMEGFVALIHLFAYFIVAGAVLSTEKLWMKFFNTIVGTSVLMIFYGLLQLGGAITIDQSSTRLDGTFGNASYLAVYMLFCIAFTAFLLVRHRGESLMKWVYGIIIAFQAFILFYTGTRGVIFGFIIGSAFSALLVLLFVKKNRRVKNFSVGVVVALLLAIVAIGTARNTAFVKTSPILDRVASFSLTEAMNNPRFMVWGMALEGFKERPVLGWGQENFNLVFNKYYDPKMYSQEQWFDRAHNIFFDWLIAGGILGLLGYLSLFFVAFAFVWKNESDIRKRGESRLLRWKNSIKSYFSGERAQKSIEASILSGLLLAYFINNVFVFDNLFSYILFFSLLAYVHRSHAYSAPVLPTKNQQQIRKVREEEIPFVVIGVPVFAIFILFLYFVNLKPIFANQALIDAIQTHAGNAFTKENLQAFRDVIDYDTFGSGEAREQLLQSAMTIKSSSIDDKLKQETFDFAKEQIALQIQNSPDDARYEMFAGMLYFRYGQNAEALAHFEQAHKESPKKQTLDFNLILSYLNARENDKAYVLAKEAYENEPSNSASALHYAITSLYKGDEAFANELLAKTFGTELYYDETLINVYADLRQFDKITAILQKKLSDGGDNPQIRLRLAASYLEAGKKAEATAEIQKIISAHPEFKAQGEYYLEQIRSGKKT